MGIFNKSIIGLELDSQEIRAVELKGTKKKPVVIAWGKVRLPVGTVKDGRIINPVQFSASLERLLNENSFNSRDAILGVNNQDVIVRFATFPKVPEDKIKSMIQFQAQDYIPISMDEIELDYIVVSEKKTEEGEFINVVLVGARKKMLNDFIDSLTASGIFIKEIDSTMLALGRAALIESQDGTFAMVGFNHDIANILIFRDGVLEMARSVSISQTQQTSELNFEEKIGIVADILFSEIKTSVNYYMMQHKQNIGKIIILGIDSNQEKIANRLKQMTELNVKVSDPYSYLKNTVKSQSGNLNSSEFAAAISLAIKGLGEK